MVVLGKLAHANQAQVGIGAPRRKEHLQSIVRYAAFATFCGLFNLLPAHSFTEVLVSAVKDHSILSVASFTALILKRKLDDLWLRGLRLPPGSQLTEIGMRVAASQDSPAQLPSRQPQRLSPAAEPTGQRVLASVDSAIEADPRKRYSVNI